MLNNEQQAVAMGAVRDQMLAVLARHENETHGGAACVANRASVIAYFAHCLGVRGEAWDYAAELLMQYDADCPGNDCPHEQKR